MTLCSQDGRCVAVRDGRCVGYLSPDELAEYLTRLGLDAVLDARGAPIDQQQCPRLVNLLAATGFSGALDFGEAQFGGVANFRVTRFSGNTYFDPVRFSGDADVSDAHWSAAAATRATA